MSILSKRETTRRDVSKMDLKVLTGSFSVCKVADYSQVNLDAAFCFIGKTDEENSLVCLTEDVPSNVIARDDGWRAFRIEGTLDFSLIGILAKISAVLAAEKIGIFVVSTYSTDYVLVKSDQLDHAKKALKAAGYPIL